MLNAANEAVASTTSATVITISLYVPTSPLSGVPVKAPVAVLKLAHSGWFVIEYVRVSSLSASEPIGVNE